jgi:hypothetical protein
MDYSTPEKQEKRLAEFVQSYGRNFRAIARLIGGCPREDLSDYRPEDAGEAPQGARW